MNNIGLNELVKPIAERHGFDRASAEFTSYSDFKIRWTRSYKWIDMTVSDYLRDAPTDVIADIIDIMLSKIKGEYAEYSDATNEYLTSAEFRDVNLKTFLKRKHFTEHPETDEIRKILEEYGIDIPELRIVKGGNYGSSTFFRVLEAPEDYDEPKIVEKANMIVDGLVQYGAL